MPNTSPASDLYTFATSGYDLVRKAMRKLRVLGVDQEPTARELADGLADLNLLRDSMNGDGMLIYARIAESFTLSASDGEYTIGPGGDMDTARPVRILEGEAFINDGSIQFPLAVMEQADWAAIPNTAIDGLPRSIYYEPAHPLGVVRFYPRPQVADSFVLYQRTLLAQIVNGNAAFSLPPVYADALLYNLAIRMSDDYGKEPSSSIIAHASLAIAKIKKMNQRTPTLANDTPQSRGSGYDIQTGRSQ
jgi:hypothetical protein